MGDVQSMGIIGAGFMGSGIAESSARAGVDVVIYEIEQAPLDRSRASIETSVKKAVSRGKLDEGQGEDLLNRVVWTTEMGALEGSEVVVEAVTEDMRVKGKIFQQLDAMLGDDVLLASNTSSIPIAQIASWTNTPERVLGLHFFSPVPVMPLIEIVRAICTDDASLARAEAFAKQINKTPVVTKDSSGFIVNMLLVPYLMAAVRMYQDGFASREDIDVGMKLGCGHPMGPLTLADFIGLDVLYAICEALFEEHKRPEYAPPPLLKRMVVSGMHGRKSGRGFYEYE